MVIIDRGHKYDVCSYCLNFTENHTQISYFISIYCRGQLTESLILLFFLLGNISVILFYSWPRFIAAVFLLIFIFSIFINILVHIYIYKTAPIPFWPFCPLDPQIAKFCVLKITKSNYLYYGLGWTYIQRNWPTHPSQSDKIRIFGPICLWQNFEIFLKYYFYGDLLC